MSECKPNNEYILKRGEVNTLLEFTLEDEDGPVNLSGWTVTVTAKAKTGGTKVIDNGACTLLPNQSTTDKGKGYYTFNSTTANIAAGVYDLEFKGVAPGSRVAFFPKDQYEPYARLRVIESL